MDNKPKIVCLCGSTRFYDEFQKVNYEETMKGKIVLTVGFYVNNEHGQSIGCTILEKFMLDELHRRKIDLCDEILVINKYFYIGESTKNEMVYAYINKKTIRWRCSPVNEFIYPSGIIYYFPYKRYILSNSGIEEESIP